MSTTQLFDPFDLVSYIQDAGTMPARNPNFKKPFPTYYNAALHSLNVAAFVCSNFPRTHTTLPQTSEELFSSIACVRKALCALFCTVPCVVLGDNANEQLLTQLHGSIWKDFFPKDLIPTQDDSEDMLGAHTAVFLSAQEAFFYVPLTDAEKELTLTIHGVAAPLDFSYTAAKRAPLQLKYDIRRCTGRLKALYKTVCDETFLYKGGE